MGILFNKEFNTLEELFVAQIEDLYDAEKRLQQALPKMADAATSSRLKSAFQAHLRETDGQVTRLEQIFQLLGMEPQRDTCDAMKGLISEGEEMVKAKGNDMVRDAALIAAAQRVEHYEIAGYGTARTFAHQLGHTRAAELLEATLKEEKSTDETLTDIAEESVNVRAPNG